MLHFVCRSALCTKKVWWLVGSSPGWPQVWKAAWREGGARHPILDGREALRGRAERRFGGDSPLERQEALRERRERRALTCGELHSLSTGEQARPRATGICFCKSLSWGDGVGGGGNVKFVNFLFSETQTVKPQLFLCLLFYFPTHTGTQFPIKCSPVLQKQLNILNSSDICNTSIHHDLHWAWMSCRCKLKQAFNHLEPPICETPKVVNPNGRKPRTPLKES